MPAYPFNPATLTWNPHPHPGGSFRPQGVIVHHGVKHNPQAWDSRRTITGRIIVGFNVGPDPRWSLDDLIPLVERVRTAQTGDPSSTFLTQRGIYKHHDGSGIVHEDGAQVFVINMTASQRDFEAQMVELAEIIAAQLLQETVIVEIQVNGVSKHVIGVTPSKPGEIPPAPKPVRRRRPGFRRVAS